MSAVPPLSKSMQVLAFDKVGTALNLPACTSPVTYLAADLAVDLLTMRSARASAVLSRQP